MAFLQFSNILVANVFETNETIEVAQFNPDNDGELKYIRCQLHVHGNLPGGTEKIRCKIGLKDDESNPYATSDWVDMADFDDSSGANDWLGWVRFDFARQNINNQQTYYIWLETANYTRNGTTFYVACMFDYPYPVYSNASWAFQWFQYEG